MRLSALVMVSLFLASFGSQYKFGIVPYVDWKVYPLVSLRQLQNDEQFQQAFIDFYNKNGGLRTQSHSTSNSSSWCGIILEDGLLQTVSDGGSANPTVVLWWGGQPCVCGNFSKTTQLGTNAAPFYWSTMTPEVIRGWYTFVGHSSLALIVDPPVPPATKSPSPTPFSSPSTPIHSEGFNCCQYYDPQNNYETSLCLAFNQNCPAVQGFYPVGNSTVSSCAYCTPQ